MALKWYFPDEEGAEQALSLLRDHVEEKVELHAPSLIDYEVLNGALVALRKGRLEREH
ncbi:type II toxin-antitoxin system VapC family toxin [Candidatus Hakubella thermalkaliphila]|uniref:type II toxin-antitoxin system VapC family toxin n=1 Tax=Candidatus Hakubella thermalkaliphila TaxID=2754717 RepID=UPI0015937091|nr:type II toxin-antitoxin system VapC family toxin [Candidatus Hakubella thermalkaliphila]